MVMVVFSKIKTKEGIIGIILLFSDAND